MPRGLLGIAPGLDGMIAAEQMADQRGIKNFGIAKGILGMRNDAEDRAVQQQMVPLKMKLLEAQVRKAGQPSITKVDGGNRIILLDEAGNEIGSIPKAASPDAVLREGGAMRRHEIPSGSAVLSNQGAMERHATPSGSAMYSGQIQMRGQNMSDARARERLDQPVYDSDRGVFVPRTPQNGQPIPRAPGAAPRAAPGAAPAPLPPSRDERKAEADKLKKEGELKKTVDMYVAARDGLMGGLEGTTTGPVMGNIPAVTSGQQIAEGGVAAMAPVLKQLFRVSGEGVFTDRDQALLLDMVPKRTDNPAARTEKMANIDRIVSAKLGVPINEGSDIGSQVRAAGVEYQPNLYEYRVVNGQVQRKKK